MVVIKKFRAKKYPLRRKKVKFWAFTWGRVLGDMHLNYPEEKYCL